MKSGHVPRGSRPQLVDDPLGDAAERRLVVVERRDDNGDDLDVAAVVGLRELGRGEYGTHVGDAAELLVLRVAESLHVDAVGVDVGGQAREAPPR